jgi:hypothetical protein
MRAPANVAAPHAFEEENDDYRVAAPIRLLDPGFWLLTPSP